jgi:hypothetical protein
MGDGFMEYYIVSLKWTSKADSALTLYRHESNGYCWRKDWAGVFGEEAKTKDDLTVAISKEIADPLFVKTIYDGEEIMVLPNNKKTLQTLDINSSKMRPKKYRNCFMSYYHSPKRQPGAYAR